MPVLLRQRTVHEHELKVMKTREKRQNLEPACTDTELWMSLAKKQKYEERCECF